MVFQQNGSATSPCGSRQKTKSKRPKDSVSSRFSLEETGPRIEGFLRRTIDNAGFELDFAVEPGGDANPDFENPDLTVKFRGRDVETLLANKAELLLSLELITQEMLRMHSDEHSRISFDANDYRALRIEELRMSALAAAEKVKRTGAPFRFNPMNSRERRVIHIALRNEHDLRSESLGSGPQRGVVIYPAGMPSLPEPPPFVPVPAQARGGFRDRDRGPRPHGDGGRSRGSGPGRGGPPRGRR
jgi:spoIIIJ-associated protein